MYSTQSEGKPVKIYQNFKNKTYKYITSISKNVLIDQLNDVVNEYQNTYHKTK